MKPEDFVSPKALTKLIVNRKKTVTNEKVEWLKIRWIRVSSDNPLQFSCRYTHNTLEEWKVVDVKRKTKGRPGSSASDVSDSSSVSGRSPLSCW